MTDETHLDGAAPTAEKQPHATKRGLVIVAGAVAALFLLFLIVQLGTAAARGIDGRSGAGAGVASGPVTVAIDGEGTANVTIDQDGSVEQHTGETLPYSFTADSSTSIISVGAQETSGDGGDLSCSITDASGTVIKQAQSTGQYTTVNCATKLD